jgi:hypothetical protein
MLKAEIGKIGAPWDLRIALLILALPTLDCAEGDTSSGRRVQGDLGVQEMSHAPDMRAQDMRQQADLGRSDAPPPGAVEVCVLPDEAPDGVCEPNGVFDFGVVGDQDVTRLLRIDNKTNNTLSFLAAAIDSDAFVIEVLLYTADPGDPSNLLPFDQELPVDRATQGSLWFKTTVSPSPDAGPLPASEMVITVSEAGADSIDLVVPISGEYSGCPTGLADCDADPQTGCETDLQIDLLHCGACGIPCELDHASVSCEAGECLLVECEMGLRTAIRIRSTDARSTLVQMA